MTQQAPSDPVTQLDCLLSAKAPANTAPYPLMITRLDNGQWWTCVHIRVPGDCDFNVEATGKTIEAALRPIRTSLNNYEMTRAKAIRTDRQYGISCP